MFAKVRVENFTGDKAVLNGVYARSGSGLAYAQTGNQPAVILFDPLEPERRPWTWKIRSGGSGMTVETGLAVARTQGASDHVPPVGAFKFEGRQILIRAPSTVLGWQPSGTGPVGAAPAAAPVAQQHGDAAALGGVSPDLHLNILKHLDGTTLAAVELVAKVFAERIYTVDGDGTDAAAAATRISLSDKAAKVSLEGRFPDVSFRLAGGESWRQLLARVDKCQADPWVGTGLSRTFGRCFAHATERLPDGADGTRCTPPTESPPHLIAWLEEVAGRG